MPKSLLLNFDFHCPDQVVEQILWDSSHWLRWWLSTRKVCPWSQGQDNRSEVSVPLPSLEKAPWQCNSQDFTACREMGEIRDGVRLENGWAPSCIMQRMVESYLWMWRWALPLALHHSCSRRKNGTTDSRKGTAVCLLYFHPPLVAILMAAYQISEDIRHLFLMILIFCRAFSKASGSILEMVSGTWILLKAVMWGKACLLPWLQGSDFQRGQTAAQVSHAAHSSRGTASPCLVSSHKFAWLCGCIWLIWLCKLGYSPRYAAEKPALWIRAFVKMDPICTWFHQLHEMYRTFIWWNRQTPCSKREKPFCLLFHRRLLPYEEVKPSGMLLCS